MDLQISQHSCSSRLFWPDCVRVFACFLVCLIHAPLPADTSSRWLSCYNYLSSPSIGLFFMVSGALLFPVRLPLKNFIVRRLKRILIPLLFWSVVAVGVHYGLGQLSKEEALGLIVRMPFAPVEGVYWFMYTILGLYLFAPLISPAIEKMAHAKYMLVLWGITLCLPYCNAWMPGYWTFKGDLYHVLGEFAGFMGYMVLGYYLRYQQHDRLSILMLAPCLLIALVIPAYFVDGRYAGVSNDMLYQYLTINVASLSVIYFVCIKKVDAICRVPCLNRGGGCICCMLVRRLIQDISRKSFGMYLVHILIMRQVIWAVWREYCPSVGYAIQIPAIAILTFLLSYILMKLLSLLPCSKYIY